MKAEIILSKINSEKSNIYNVEFNIVDENNKKITELAEYDSIIRRLIIRSCSRAMIHGWTIRTLSSRLRKKSFKPFEVLGIKKIMLIYDADLFDKIEKDYKDLIASNKKQKLDFERKVKIATPAMQMYRIVKNSGNVLKLQKHFESFGVSESTFYRWFYDPSDKTEQRKDVSMRNMSDGKSPHGMGRFRKYEMNGLMYYLQKFSEDYESMQPIEGIESVEYIER